MIWLGTGLDRGKPASWTYQIGWQSKRKEKPTNKAGRSHLGEVAVSAAPHGGSSTVEGFNSASIVHSRSPPRPEERFRHFEAARHWELEACWNRNRRRSFRDRLPQLDLPTADRRGRG